MTMNLWSSVLSKVVANAEKSVLHSLQETPPDWMLEMMPCCVHLPAVQKQKEADVVYADGLAANKAGDVRGALVAFHSAFELAPLKPVYLLSAANMHLKLGEKGAAKLLYTWLLSGKHLAVTEAHRKHVEGKLKKC